jgi:hypothetical protein
MRRTKFATLERKAPRQSKKPVRISLVEFQQ